MDGVMACLYGMWLLGGTLDFWFHRRTDLPHTSGLRESTLHGVQFGTAIPADVLRASRGHPAWDRPCRT